MAKREKRPVCVSTAIALAAAFAGATQAASFTPGDIIVTRAVGGSVDLTTSPPPGSVAPITSAALLGNGVASTVTVDEYTPSGTLVQSITLPNVAQTNTAPGSSYALTFSGPQVQEGLIELSGNNRYFSLVGYNQTAGQTNLTGANGTNAAPSATVQRVVGIIDMNGNYNTTTGLTDVANTVSVRSAWTSDGTNIWVNGAAKNTTQLSGIHYTTLGSTTSTIISAVDNSGRTNIVNGYDFGSGLQLLASSVGSANQTVGTVPFRGVATVGTGLPTAASTTLIPAQFPGFDATTTPPVGETADGYWFKDPHTLYIADNRNSTSTGSGNYIYGGVQKWSNINGTWTYQYNVTLGNSTVTAGQPVGAHGITGKIDPVTGDVDLFATTLDPGAFWTTEVFSIVDPAIPNATPSFNTPTLIATSATNSAFRGVSVVPYLQGDVNLDNKVDMTDLNVVLNNFGKASLIRGDGNLDGSATIDLTDLAQVLNNFGQTFGGSGSAAPSLTAAAAPEPASLALFGFGVAGVLVRRRRA